MSGKPYFEVRRSRIQGKGAFALRMIRKGTCIAEYEGERISDAEAEARYQDDEMSRHHTFLFAIRRNVSIDGAVGGNDSRFINHSCAPNCETVQEGDRVFVHAIRTIRPGEELTYDYRYKIPGRITSELREFYRCRCGAPQCRGTILVKR
jgi:SET domain-containing protein